MDESSVGIVIDALGRDPRDAFIVILCVAVGVLFRALMKVVGQFTTALANNTAALEALRSRIPGGGS